MPAGHGLRARTRDLFQRGFRQKGFINLTTYLRTYKIGDYVDIKVNAAVQKVGAGLRCWRGSKAGRSVATGGVLLPGTRLLGGAHSTLTRILLSKAAAIMQHAHMPCLYHPVGIQCSRLQKLDAVSMACS